MAIDRLIFKGTYGSGASRFAKENSIPSPVPELGHLADWPDILVPGTFNVDVDLSNWPLVDGLDFGPRGVMCLDRNEIFPPVAYIDYRRIPRNTLNPEKNGQYGGDLQFWRATLQLEGISNETNCYMLRRVRSNYRTKIELVSDIHIQKAFQIQHGHSLSLTVFCG